MGPRLGRVLLVAAVVLCGAGLAACTPATAILVNSAGTGHDADPGDGACEVTAGGGDCTLPAAVEEANAQPSGAITVPPGTYSGMDLVVTGKVKIDWDAPVAVMLSDVSIEVAAGGHLQADGLVAAPTELEDEIVLHPARLTVAGLLQLRRSAIQSVGEDLLDGVALEVTPSGQATIEDSILLGGAHAIDNEGGVAVVRSALFNLGSGVISTGGDGVTQFQASLLSRAVNTALLTSTCAGGAATSTGYSFYGRNGAGCTQATTDLSQLAVVAYGGTGIYTLPPAAIDAIPIGEAGCSLTAVDLVGNPRGVDGNGDGVLGCDIGALELQP